MSVGTKSLSKIFFIYKLLIFVGLFLVFDAVFVINNALLTYNSIINVQQLSSVYLNDERICHIPRDVHAYHIRRCPDQSRPANRVDASHVFRITCQNHRSASVCHWLKRVAPNWLSSPVWVCPNVATARISNAGENGVDPYSVPSGLYRCRFRLRPHSLIRRRLLRRPATFICLYSSSSIPSGRSPGVRGSSPRPASTSPIHPCPETSTRDC